MIKRLISQKFLISILLCISVLNGCKKSEDQDPLPDNNGNNNTNQNISPVPDGFSQKVLIEQFTGAWNGGCPDGIFRMDQLIAGNSKIIGINLHMGDAMETSLFNSCIATFNNNNLPQFPSAMVNRTPSLGYVILSKTQWASNATIALSHSANCGLAIKSKTTGTTAEIEVHSGFMASLSGTYSLNVYLVENGVTGTGTAFDQVNTNTSNDPSSPYYNKPNPITGFVHNNVVRKALTAPAGDIIESSNIFAGGEDIKNYTVDISGKDLGKLYLVAFINKTGTSAITHQVMNVQVCGLNNLKNWD